MVYPMVLSDTGVDVRTCNVIVRKKMAEADFARFIRWQLRTFGINYKIIYIGNELVCKEQLLLRGCVYTFLQGDNAHEPSLLLYSIP